MRKTLGIVVALVVAVATIGFVGGRSASAAEAPIANAGGPYTGVVGVPVQFSGNFSSGYNLAFTWEFGDGTTAAGPTPVKSFAAAGTYTVRLTVRDMFGATAVATSSATIGGIAFPAGAVAVAGMPCTPVPGVLNCWGWNSVYSWGGNWGCSAMYGIYACSGLPGGCYTTSAGVICNGAAGWNGWTGISGIACGTITGYCTSSWVLPAGFQNWTQVCSSVNFRNHQYCIQYRGWYGW